MIATNIVKTNILLVFIAFSPQNTLLNIKLRDTVVQSFHFLERSVHSIPYPRDVLYIMIRDE